jgi:hypothetical protein
MQTNGSGLRAIKEISLDCIFDVEAQLLPRIGLRDNAFCEAFGDIAAIRLLDHFKHQIADRNGIHFVLKSTLAFWVRRGQWLPRNNKPLKYYRWEAWPEATLALKSADSLRGTVMAVQLPDWAAKCLANSMICPM